MADILRQGHNAPRVTRIIAVANEKGGVGKTTTAINLSAALADLGHFTLLADIDPQAHATHGMGLDPGTFPWKATCTASSCSSANTMAAPSWTSFALAYWLRSRGGPSAARPERTTE